MDSLEKPGKSTENAKPGENPQKNAWIPPKNMGKSTENAWKQKMRGFVRKTGEIHCVLPSCTKLVRGGVRGFESDCLMHSLLDA